MVGWLLGCGAGVVLPPYACVQLATVAMQLLILCRQSGGRRDCSHIPYYGLGTAHTYRITVSFLIIDDREPNFLLITSPILKGCIRNLEILTTVVLQQKSIFLGRKYIQVILICNCFRNYGIIIVTMDKFICQTPQLIFQSHIVIFFHKKYNWYYL